MEVIMTLLSRRMLLASALLVALTPSSALFAADNPKEMEAIRQAEAAIEREALMRIPMAPGGTTGRD